MEVIRTEQIWVKSEDIPSGLCHFSKNLWNEANYQVFTNQQVKIENGYIIFSKKLNLNIKTRWEDYTKIREARIITKGTGYVLEIVYEKKAEPLNLNSDRIIGIDFGLRNIVTIGNNIGEQPIVIKGSALKSMNQYYNKRKAEIQSIYDKQGIKTGTEERKLTEKRNRKIKDVMHKISRYIVNWCIDHNIGTIVIGHNDNWKQEANLGRRNNQNFVSIPYYILTHDIQYKAEEIEGVGLHPKRANIKMILSFIDGS